MAMSSPSNRKRRFAERCEPSIVRSSQIGQSPFRFHPERNSALALPERRQHFHARMAVRLQAQLGLEGLDRRAGAFADLAIELAVVIAVGGQSLLKLLLFLEGELGERPLPVLHQPAIAGDFV